MSKQILELRQKRAKCVHDAQEILKKFSTEPNGIPAEENQRATSFLDEADKLKTQIDLEERALDAAADLEEIIERKGGKENTGQKKDSKEIDESYKRAFADYMRVGLADMSEENKVILRSQGYRPDEQRAQTVTTTGGGYLIPQGFRKELEVAMLPFSGMMESGAEIMRTDTGNLIPFPTVDDTSNKGALLAINTQESEQALTFGNVNFNAYKFTSKNVLVPIELMQDSAFDMEAMLKARLAERIGRILNQYFTTGTGTNQPQGIVPFATAGSTAAASGAIAFNDLVELQHSVNRAYRIGAKWMMADSTLKIVKKMVDTENRPLFIPGVALKEPDTILGHAYIVNDDMAAVEASAKSIVFGQMSKYKIRLVTDFVLMRLVERYADYYQVAFQMFVRADGRGVDAGTHPLKYLIHPSP